MNKRLIDYVRIIKSEDGSQEILTEKSYSEHPVDPTGSNISITRRVYNFKDGVSIEYEREHDDGSPYPGCQTFFYTYRVTNTNGFNFDGETTQVFDGLSKVRNWLAQIDSSDKL
jgi:hypothetical protein